MSDARDAWVGRVLGFTVARGGGVGDERLSRARSSLAALAGRVGEGPTRAASLALSEAEAVTRAGDAETGRALVERAERMAREVAARQALAGWRSARVVALNMVDQLIAALETTDTPQRDTAIGLLRGIGARLPDVPEGPVAALERSIEADGIVAAADGPNAFGVRVAIREELGQALAALRASEAAQQEAG